MQCFCKTTFEDDKYIIDLHMKGMKGMSANANIPIFDNKLIGCQSWTSTHKGCNRQSAMSRPQYEQICTYWSPICIRQVKWREIV